MLTRTVVRLFLLVVSIQATQAGRVYTATLGEPVVANQLIVRMKHGASASSVVGSFLQGAQVRALGAMDLYLVRMPREVAAVEAMRLGAHPLVEFVEPNRVRHAGIVPPNDPNYSVSQQWGLFAVQAYQAWSVLPAQYLTAALAGTSRVKVAVLDSGADCTHPDFVNSGGASTDSLSGGQLAWSVSHVLVPPNGSVINKLTCPWQDDYGHGTATAGVIAAATANGTGVAALGYPLQLVIYKVLDSNGRGDDATIASAIIMAADAGVQVISMSFGEVGYSQTLQSAVDYAWQRNVLVLAAAGNDAMNEPFEPASTNHVVGVSATDQNNNLATFSNFGNGVQLAAPGVAILTTLPTYSVALGCCDYGTFSGTSLSTPFVSALAGLIAMTTPNPSAVAILQRMEQTASSPLSAGGWNQDFGYGIINAYDAIAGNTQSTATGGVIGQIVDVFAPITFSPGNPVAGAQVTIGGLIIVTDLTGIYRFTGLAPGTYPVIVTLGTEVLSLSATVAAGADTSLTVALGESYGKFTGQVTDQGAGVPGAIVAALSSGLIVTTAVADTNGTFTLWVPGGSSFNVQASEIGFVTTTTAPQSVITGGSALINITLSRMGAIQGTVTDSSSHLIPGAYVVVATGTVRAGAFTDDNGNYIVRYLPNGTYSATASVGGAGSVTDSSIMVAANSAPIVNLQLQSSISSVNSVPPGLILIVDGISCAAPCDVQWTPGTIHSIDVPPVPQAEFTGTQYTFAGWSDNGAQSHSVTASSPARTFTATFTTQYYLTTSVNPPGMGTITPASGWYNMGTVVWASESSTTGSRFTGFSGGALFGTAAPQSLTMIAPTTVTANFIVSINGPAWYNSAWAVRKAITIRPINLAGTVSHFPMLYSVTDADLVGLTQDTFNDILFTASDGVTKLNHEIESFNSVTGALVAWVNVPTISPGTTFYLYYGNPVAENQQSALGVWDANYLEVFHLATSGATINAKDSTSNADNGVAAFVAATTGEVAGGGLWNGFSSKIDFAGNALRSAFTIEAWIYVPYSVSSPQSIVGSGLGGIDLELVPSNNSGAAGKLALGQPGYAGLENPATITLSTVGWHHIAATTDASGNYSYYLDGTLAGNFSGGVFAHDPGANTNALGYRSGSENDFYSGSMDEVRVSNIARPAAWFAAEVLNQIKGDLFTTGEAQVQGIGITITSVPTGLSLIIDGVTCNTPCKFLWQPGTTHTISPTNGIQAGTSGTQFMFASWSDGGTQSHNVIIPPSPELYTANFTIQYLITTSATTGGTISPATGWNDNGSILSVNGTASSGSVFDGFSGSLSGIITPQSLTVTGPMGVTASFEPTTAKTPLLQMLFPIPGSTLTSKSVTFSWTSTTGADQYRLFVGSAAGQSDIFASITAETSASVNNLPCDGRAIYVQLEAELSGVFQNPVRYQYTAKSGCSFLDVDFNGDGKSDVLLYDPASGNAYVGLSTGAGGFDYVSSLMTPGFDVVRYGRFNSDAYADAIVYNSTSGLGYSLLGTGTGKFQGVSLADSCGLIGFKTAATGDLNGDGLTDLVMYRATDGSLCTAISNGDGTFHYQSTMVSPGFTNLQVADFNGDGKADVFFYRASDGVAFLGTSNGSGGFAFSPVTISNGFDFIETGDLNGDGKADLLVYASSTGAAYMGISTGSGFTFARLAASPGFTSVKLMDYNGDGFADIIFYNQNNTLGYLLIGNGAGTFTTSSLFWGAGMQLVEVGDLNGDGKPDVIIYDTNNAAAYTGLNTGNPSNPFTYTYSYWGTGRVVVGAFAQP